MENGGYGYCADCGDLKHASYVLIDFSQKAYTSDVIQIDLDRKIVWFFVF